MTECSQTYVRNIEDEDDIYADCESGPNECIAILADTVEISEHREYTHWFPLVFHIRG